MGVLPLPGFGLQQLPASCGCSVVSGYRLPDCDDCLITVSMAYGAQVLRSHPDAHFIILGREHPTEPLAGRLMRNLMDLASSLVQIHAPCLDWPWTPLPCLTSP